MCEDMHKQCAKWQSAGECDKNKGFMVGDANGGGNCRKACGACKACSSDDVDCINENRKAAGYLPLKKEEMEWLGAGWWLDDHSPEL